MDAPIIGQEPTFTITETKLYFPVVTLSAQDYGKLLKQLKSGFKRSIRNKLRIKSGIDIIQK